MNLTRLARATSAAVVAGVAAVASYSHMRDLAAEHGQSPLLANLLPVSVDGMLIVASAVMADDRAAGRPARMSARVSFVVGVAASIVANVLAAQDDLVARVISAWPALALLLVVEMLAGKPRRGRPVEPVAEPVAEPVRSTPEPVAEPIRQRVTPRTLTAAARVEAAHDKHPTATHERLAQLAGVSVATVKRYRPKRPVSGSASAPVAAEMAINGTTVEVSA